MICEKSEIALNTGCLHRMTTNLTTKTHIYPVVGIFLTTYRGFPDHKSDHEKKPVFWLFFSAKYRFPYLSTSHRHHFL